MGISAKKARKLSEMNRSSVSWYNSIMKQIKSRASNGIRYYNVGLTDVDVIILLKEDGYSVDDRGTIRW